MHDYKAPLWDMRFVLDHIVHADEISELPGYDHADPDFVYGMLEEAAKFFTEVVAPTNHIGDTDGSTIEDGCVHLPADFVSAYEKLISAGWNALPFDTEYGGGGMPWTATTPVQEMLVASNNAFSMLPGLTQGAFEMILTHGSEEQKEAYLPKFVSGEWAGTMNLTEPEAGSDVGALRTRALHQDDGTYRISGTKIFITMGDQDATANIVHLVLARTPDAPPGTKGISCFIVPKYLVNSDGSLGDRNDVECVSIEHKMGIKASPTCVLSFGEQDGAIGYLIGEENHGMHYMFTMMNNARLAVALGGLGVAERAYQQAVAYARERVQGRPIGAPKGEREGEGERATIIAHADVRRMLMTMKARIEAMRALSYVAAGATDRAERHPDEDVRQRNQRFVDLVTPVAKAWNSDIGCEVCSTAIQVYGGMGYIEETGVSQHYRDSRIGPIYEGTNGIQALDLIGRKLPMDGGKPVLDLIAEMRSTAEELAKAGEAFGTISENLADSVDALERATLWIFEHGLLDPNDAAAGASPYLRLFGVTLGGWLLGKEAIAARSCLDAGADQSDAPLLEAKLQTARFYAEQLLPEAQALVGPVTRGKESLYAIAPEHF